LILLMEPPQQPHFTNPVGSVFLSGACCRFGGCIER
jgi:hypothetical protein